jgi:hypothetical protein
MSAGRFLKRLLVILVVPALFAVALITLGPSIKEWYVLSNYTPPSEIQALANQTTMTDKARRLFYLNDPQLLDRSQFNASCEGAGGEQTIVLGCYHSPQQGIYVFHVSEAELRGIEQVTAAHEMLHAAYDKLSTKERKRIDTLLTDYYRAQLKDTRIKEVIDIYERRTPEELPNEMHSIFGTEVESLPAELEEYYKQYFTDRSVVVDYAQRYQAAFSSRQDEISTYDLKLLALETQIGVNQASLDQQASALKADRSVVERSRDQEQVDSYNQRVSSYNALLAQTNSLVEQYNQLVNERNAIALEQKQLQQSINSSIQ